MDDLLDAMAYIVRTKEILFLTVLAFVLNFILSPVNVIFPVFSVGLGAGPEGFGLLSATIAAGMLLGTLVAGLMGDRLPYVWALALGLGGISLALLGLSFATTLLVAITWVAGLGGATPLVQIPLVTRLQLQVPKDYQGRTFATMNTLTQAALPLSAGTVGWALQYAGVDTVFQGAAASLGLLLLLWVGLQGFLRRSSPAGALDTTWQGLSTDLPSSESGMAE